jgi:hypothetical protein
VVFPARFGRRARRCKNCEVSTAVAGVPDLAPVDGDEHRGRGILPLQDEAVGALAVDDLGRRGDPAAAEGVTQRRGDVAAEGTGGKSHGMHLDAGANWLQVALRQEAEEVRRASRQRMG